jgi:hypothetical protein
MFYLLHDKVGSLRVAWIGIDSIAEKCLMNESIYICKSKCDHAVLIITLFNILICLKILSNGSKQIKFFVIISFF